PGAAGLPADGRVARRGRAADRGTECRIARLAPIDADRSGAAHEYVEQPARDGDVLEEVVVLRLILLGRHGPERMAEDRGDDGERHQERRRQPGLHAQDERRAAEELDDRGDHRPGDRRPGHALAGEVMGEALEARTVYPG